MTVVGLFIQTVGSLGIYDFKVKFGIFPDEKSVRFFKDPNFIGHLLVILYIFL